VDAVPLVIYFEQLTASYTVA